MCEDIAVLDSRAGPPPPIPPDVEGQVYFRTDWRTLWMVRYGEWEPIATAD